MTNDYDKYYKEKFRQGIEFQDLVSMTLYRYGIVLGNFSSKKYQYSMGENMLGAEVKLDMNFRSTGNLYIETAEKAHPDRPEYTRSGVDRDSSWLFIIGDEKEIWIFSVKHLRLLRQHCSCVRTTTSKGFLLPLSLANKECIRKIRMKGKDDEKA